jgi:microcystin-dependent protein
MFAKIFLAVACVVVACLVFLQQKGAPPIGSVVAWPTASCPHDYLPCDGRAVSSKKYPRLYKVLGTKYGHGDHAADGVDSQRDFNLPDFRGMFLRGADLGRGKDPDGGRELGSIQEYATARPHKNFVFKALPVHDHGGGSTVQKRHDNTPSGLDSGGDEIDTSNIIPQVPRSAGTPEMNTDEGGDAETRPINVTVIYAIRAE